MSELTVETIRTIDARMVEFEGVNERYCRFYVGGNHFVQWLKPVTGPIAYGFELIVDEGERDRLELAYQSGLTKGTLQ